MSFMTPIRLQDASRILRGVALVAAKAAVESPALRRAGEGDLSSAVQEALKSISRQTKQVADVLDKASRDQTGASVQKHLQTGQRVAEEVASAIADQTRGVLREGQQTAQSTLRNPGAAVNRAVEEGKRAAESTVAHAQQVAAGLSQSAPAAVRSTAQQGQEAAEWALRQGSQGLREGRAVAQASGLGDPADETLGNLADQMGRQADSLSHESAGKSIRVDFSSGVGSATSGTMSNLPEVEQAASSTEQLNSSPTALGSQTEGLSMHVTAGSQGSGREAALDSSVSGMQSPSQAPRSSGQDAAAVDSGARNGASEATQRQTAADAAAVLHSRADTGGKAATPGGRQEPVEDAQRLAAEEQRLSQQEADASGVEKAQVEAKKEEVRRRLRERRVPSSPFGRVAGFAQLGASLVYGTVADQVSSYFGGGERQTGGGNAYLTERNAERLADALCRMRGAALKLGQMLSIQDENVLPPQLTAALERVRAGADVMPRKQLHKVLGSELGSDWRAKVREFDDEPLAAASIGQVHGATLHDGRRVVLKIQYPGVARSIESDVDNLLRIISLANILPKGLYVENAAKVAKKELKLECDYAYEARCQMRFKQLIEDDKDFRDVMSVPAVIPELSSNSVLCTERVPGVHIDKVAQMPQKVRDAVGTLLLQLTLRELFEWRFMQTDPNWGNFLYDEAAGKLHLIDFGAAREFPVGFVDDYLNMVRACAERDKQGVVDCSTRLGFLTGDESKMMLDAHSQAGFVVGTPFARPGLYNFASHHSLTKEVSELGAVMLKHRLTPPPEESYSLHRKLSGAFLACIKLRAQVPCRDLFYSAYDSHQWGHEGVTVDGLPELRLASG